jgi:hypothetical protein
MANPIKCVQKLVAWSLAISALIGCTQSADPSQPQPPASDQQVEQTKQALNTGLPSEAGLYPLKGHTQALSAAFRALSRRPNLLPPQMATPENQYYVQYGNYFADNTWVNRPGTLHAQRAQGNASGVFQNTPSAASANMSNAIKGEVVFSSDNTEYTWDDYHAGIECWYIFCAPVFVPLTMHLRASGKVRWVDYMTNDKPNAHAEFKLDLNLFSTSIAGISQTPVERTYSLDNLYHYSFRDVYQMPGLSQAERDENATLKLYPLVLSDLGDTGDDDIANKAISYLVNQPIVAGADRGITKYGADSRRQRHSGISCWLYPGHRKTLKFQPGVSPYQAWRNALHVLERDQSQGYVC